MPVAHDAIEPELSCSGILKPQYRRRCNRWVHVGKYKCSGCGETLFKWEEGRWSHSNAFRAMEDKQRWARDGGLPLKTCASLDSGSSCSRSSDGKPSSRPATSSAWRSTSKGGE